MTPAGLRPPLPSSGRSVLHPRLGPRACAVALALAGLLALPAAATAQSPQRWLQATPSPFLPTATIAIEATVALNAPYESFCDAGWWPPCVVLSVYTSAQVTRPGGFSAFADDWSGDGATLQTADPGPGQSLQPTTYTLTGMVVVTYCEWDPFLSDCYAPPQEYVEWGQTQATVYPVIYPSADSVSPSSGNGLSQTFTLMYSSAAGAGDIAEMDFWMGGGGASLPCHLRYWAGSHDIGLYDDAAGVWLQAPIGAAGSLQNGRCLLNTAATGATPSGTQWTVTLPLAFESGWPGTRELWLLAKSAWGGDSGWQHRGYWTVPCSAQVTPNPTQLGGGSGQTSFSIDTPAGCGWTAPAASDFLTLVSAGSGSGPGQVQYSYTANFGAQARASHPVIAGQTVTVTQAAAPAEVFYYHTDALGSVRAITDAGGQVVATADFLPFGDDWQPTGGLDPRGFAQMERTPDTGTASWADLNYAGARYYHAQTGRFTSPDPGHVGLHLENPQTWNAYAYAGNNPLRWVDPTGTDYIISAYDGTPFWFDEGFGDFRGLQRYLTDQGFRWAGDADSGYILNAAGHPVAEYQYFDRWRRVFGGAGLMAQQGLEEFGTQMAVNAAIAATGGLAAGAFSGGLVARGLSVTQVAGRDAIVLFKIGAANTSALRAAGISEWAAKEAVKMLIQSKLVRVPSSGTKIEGFIEINGRLLKVTAGVDAAGQISVGAIRLVR